MSALTTGDIPLLVSSENSSSERRITPSWTIGQLKARLEPVTGIPPLSQKLTLKLGSHQAVLIEATDEENTQLATFPLAPYGEIHVSRGSLPYRFAKRVVRLYSYYAFEAVPGETFLSRHLMCEWTPSLA
jgi:hypothetical protein